MTPVILFVLGAPGVGKTTLVRRIMDEYTPRSLRRFTESPYPKWTHSSVLATPRFAAAGHYKGTTFDGADTVPYNGALAALEYWAENLLGIVDLTIFDGARFSTTPSFERIRRFAPQHAIVGVHLVGEEAASARRDARGSKQNASWVKGATTGARNFAAATGAVDIDANAEVETVFKNVHALIKKANQ